MAGSSIGAALAASTADLGEFEGADVLSVGIEIPSAAGGLRESLQIDPQIMHRGDEVLVLLRCKVGKIRHEPVKDTSGVRRVHILETTEATIVDGDEFEAALAENRQRIAEAKEAAIGKGPLEEAILQASHDDGEHADHLVDDCPACEEEKALTEAGE